MVKQPTDLQPATPIEPAAFEPARFKPLPENVFVNIGVQDMTQTAADAAKEIAKYQSAVPARNRTYQVIAGSVSVVLICRWAIDALKSDTASLASVLKASVVALGAVFVARQLTKKKK